MRYFLARPARFGVTFYDAQGRLVSVLLNRKQDVGTHSAIWAGCSEHGGRVRPGAYFVRISARGRKSTHRITRHANPDPLPGRLSARNLHLQYRGKVLPERVPEHALRAPLP